MHTDVALIQYGRSYGSEPKMGRHRRVAAGSRLAVYSLAGWARRPVLAARATRQLRCSA